MRKRILIGALAACSAPAFAEDPADPPKQPVPTVSQVLSASGITISGYVDVAYSKLNSTGLFVNAPAGPVSAGLAGNTRIFDTPGATQGRNFNSFNLQQVGLIISKQPTEGPGGYVNMTAGEDAAPIASAGFGATQTGSNNSTHTVDFTQAYASYAKGGLTVIGGKFATLAGAEYITSYSNKNYSRAWMFGWGPYTHTGVRATYVFNDKVTVIAGVNNGFDQVTSTTGTKTSELSLVLAPVSLFSLAITNYHGKELTNALVGGASLAGTRNYTDVLATVTATDKLNLVADYANGKQDNAALQGGVVGQAKWKALALYANYQMSDAWRVSLRHENFDDANGYRSALTTAAGTPLGQTLRANTLTFGYAVDKSLELRAEARYDWSTQAAFLQSNGAGKANQTSYGLQAIYQF